MGMDKKKKKKQQQPFSYLIFQDFQKIKDKERQKINLARF
jgi:hypothetical protein